MKKILITGANSYIGTSVEKWLLLQNQEAGRESYGIDTLDMQETDWRKCDFSQYDTIFHVAGIAHADIGKVSEETKALYYRVNTELTAETAAKAKREGAGQFIFMSSIIVYGDSAPVGRTKRIHADTVPNPSNFYGDSKWQAEQRILPMAEENFAVAVLRPPMIYGKGSRGNYPLLAKLAGKVPVFPDIHNERSMLHIDNLCAFIQKLMDGGQGGIFFPQNDAYVTTAEMVREIARVRGKKVRLWKLLNPLVYLAAGIPGKIGGMANKAFGSITYDREMSEKEITGYQVRSLKESIEQTETI